MSSFKNSLFNPDEFTLTFELVPGRGGRSKGQNRLLNLAREAAADGRIKAVSITENAGGHPALSPEVLGLEIQDGGLEVISHFSCKDKNRNQIESLLFSWSRTGLNNLLVITGDYPQDGYQGKPKPVFDLDCVHVLDLISHMNRGLIENGSQGKPLEFQATSFLKGVALSPFKMLVPELNMQYAKLHKKVEAGADYVITQLGFDARKYHEVLMYMRHNELALPVLGNVFVPNLPVVELMYKGEIPGCIISRELYAQIKSEADSDDHGKKARLTRAAKLMAVLKGMGYAGAHIGGPGLSFSDLDFIICEADAWEKEWRQLIPELSYWPSDGAYYFIRDEATGLNQGTPHRGSWQGRKGIPLSYDISHSIHNFFFEENGPGFGLAKKLCLGLAEAGHDNLLMKVEYLIKLLLFGCQNCGDCRLAELAYLCPQSGCAKHLLNGPCGGSRDGWCEVYPGRKRCFYVLVYKRLEEHGLTEILKEGYLPPRDWAFNNTSSWLNFFRDFDKQFKG